MARTILLLLGIVLTGVGVLGFFNDPLLGIFEVDTLHNIVHLGSGVLALIFAGNIESSQLYGKIMAAVYGLMTLAGVLSADSEVLGMSMNTADNVLHLAFTLSFLYVGFAPEAQKLMMRPHHR